MRSHMQLAVWPMEHGCRSDALIDLIGAPYDGAFALLQARCLAVHGCRDRGGLRTRIPATILISLARG